MNTDNGTLTVFRPPVPSPTDVDLVTVGTYGFDCLKCSDGVVGGRIEKKGRHKFVRAKNVECDSCDATYTVEVRSDRPSVLKGPL